MNDPNNPNNKNNNKNNQDDRGDKLGKRSVPADLDGPSQPQKKFRFLPTHLGFDVDVNQEIYSGHQLGSNFTQDMQMASSFRKINPTSNISNLIHGWGSSPTNVSQSGYRFYQIPISEPKSENPRNDDLVESRRQGKKQGSKDNSCEKQSCLSLYCECFASQLYCLNCECSNCENTVDNEHEVAALHKELLEKNPIVFDSKNFAEQHKKGCTCKNSCIIVSSEVKTQAEQDNMQVDVPVNNSYHPPINSGQGYDIRMMQGLQGHSNFHDSQFNNNNSWRSFTLMNESIETNYGTLPVELHAIATLNAQPFTPYAENVPNL
ncbi:protein tesmin/TSO1-like CXC 4 [Dioscorea cayenensis subsp. rotundata]|uniref:Protein tesmin/TSO1-like CXC 4 n=1 Tax=Dioscorea cayennensis subsp. rotundata TaxID=55577 RepID=A0AB40B3Z8_DIOCR|nr:protein tesmin/TSO1-like CXC 4 [Dioscorea cayenensis subsp. rotundata]